jgi:hypothetical protein
VVHVAMATVQLQAGIGDPVFHLAEPQLGRGGWWGIQ